MKVDPRKKEKQIKEKCCKNTSNIKHPKNTCDKIIIIKNTKKNYKKKIDINNVDSDDIFENKVTSKVSKIRKIVQAAKNITSNELVTCSKNKIFIESVHNFVLEYKGNCQNESMIKKLPKRDDLLNLNLMLLRKGLKEHVPLQKYHSHIKKK